MPELPTETPNINPNDYTSDNTNVYADVSTVLNIRSGPSTSYDIVATVSKDEVMTRIAKGKQTGELWDRVKLSNGILGYAFQSYLKEVPEEPEIPIQEIRLSLSKNPINKNEKVSLEVKILPENATDKTIKYSSSDTSIAMVDESGTILGLRSGNAIITAYSEKYNIKKEIKIQVYSEVTDLILDVTDIVLIKGQSTKINANVMPEDANNPKVIFSSNNNAIATVDSEGNISAIEEGETQIIATTEENQIQKEVNVKVVTLDENIEFTDLIIKGNIISGLEEGKNSVLEIKNKIQTTYKIEIYNENNEVLLDSQPVGTGNILKCFDENNNEVMEYIFLYYGDVNGDGKINSIDLLVLQRHILEIEKLEGVKVKAGNINKDGKKPTSRDLLLIQRHILGLQKIDQK